VEDDADDCGAGWRERGVKAHVLKKTTAGADISRAATGLKSKVVCP
jgi:hypothetical protein